MTDVLIKRELLERLAEHMKSYPGYSEARWSDYNELGAILASPRQPEGDGLEVVATLEIGDYADAESIYAQTRKEFTIDEVCDDDKLVRFSDAQRAIAELRTERDTLRQQLAERDAEIERLLNTLSETVGNGGVILRQRDKLAGLLREVRGYTDSPHIVGIIDAALAEVKP